MRLDNISMGDIGWLADAGFTGTVRGDHVELDVWWGK